jgi:two-component sensor histidine kinase
MTTNAAKYGSLSVQAGRLEVAWRIVAEKDAVEIQWTESGGPAVAPPERRGFGRTLIERVLASDLRGDVRLEFAPQGLRCLIVFPLEAAA